MAEQKAGAKTGFDAVKSMMFAERGPNNGGDLSDKELSNLGEELWAWARQVPAGERQHRIRRNPDGQPILEVVGPDVPFIVDSVLGQCLALGAAVVTLFHPVIAVDEAAQARGELLSVIHIHLGLLSELELERLDSDISKTLEDLQMVVSDFSELVARMGEERTKLAGVAHLAEDDHKDALAFLDWLIDGHFVFLGARTYRFLTGDKGEFLLEEPDMVEGANLGVLRHENRDVLSRAHEPTMLPGKADEFLNAPEPLIVAKSTMVSRIHRRIQADYIGVKHYDAKGRVTGETRFLGLFTAEAYDEAARNVPLLKRRIEQVVDLSGAQPEGHTAKAYANILETWPRDELFQTDAEALSTMVQSVVELMGRPMTRLFVRRDLFGRFVSAIVYVPRDAYDSEFRVKMIDILADAYKAELQSFQPRFDSGALVQVHVQLALPHGAVDPDIDQIEQKISALATRWEDVYRTSLTQNDMPDHAREGASLFIEAFNAAYREAFDPVEGLRDVVELAELHAGAPVRMRVYRREDDDGNAVRAKIYSRGAPIALSQSVPVFENMGLFVRFETGYPVRPTEKPRDDAPDVYWIHDMLMHAEAGRELDIDQVAEGFQDTFVAVWTGRAENDGFNRLVFEAGATWREANLLRGLSAYRRQTGMDPAKSSQIRAFATHGAITRNILNLFAALFDPQVKISDEEREAKAGRIANVLQGQLAGVRSLEDDRVLRRTINLVMAIQRTNYYMGGAGPLAFKVASAELEPMPRPIPYREIFVASPVVDGVHLRFGPVARGGLRWSDRPDDFRTEVLGLVKAQQVKNAVIVPVGSKGGFYPKQLPTGGSREDVRDAGIAAYKVFISALLELTDNLVDGEVRHPEDMIIRDGVDPYLVVAADKGTATFSDIANSISVEHGFWLGDAFASGGSAGYDHKAMGITARGAWEAVKRHFMEAGKDIQAEAFTVIGVGDMSGDVFGNGMLLSRQIRLVAAFNHMHIFIDPEPGDPEVMWTERKRMFDLGRSSWSDYNADLISQGGGVFDRSAKSIALTDEIRALTGLSGDEATPDEVIHALLKAQTDLLWFGGIGTYARATTENDREVGDRANDGIRVEAPELRAKVIGEGANLGLTQAARIEFAARGGRANTDAIDNSAGVDSSDHEVNIKILLSEVIQRKKLKAGARNKLLASMTDDVAHHVLAHNINQTRALSLTEAKAKAEHDAHERVMLYLEERGVLDRVVEGLPSSEEMRARRDAGKTLTRPELSVLLAWSKITLFDDIVASDLPDDPFFAPVLKDYFPEALHKYEDAMQQHRLKREIIATVLANRLLDAGGPAFLLVLRETGNATNASVVRAFEIAHAAIDNPARQAKISARRGKAPEAGRMALQLTLSRQTQTVAAHILSADPKGDMTELASRYKAGLAALLKDAKSQASSFNTSQFDRRMKQMLKHGISEKLAKETEATTLAVNSVGAISLANELGLPISDVAAAFNAIGGTFGIDRLRTSASNALAALPQWDALALHGQLSNLVADQLAATRNVLAGDGDIAAYLKARGPEVDKLKRQLRQMDLTRNWSFAKFALAADAVRTALG